jgi:hypothetical protein
VVERSFAWLRRNRRLAKDHERKVLTTEALIEVAMIHLLVARLGQKTVYSRKESRRCLRPAPPFA